MALKTSSAPSPGCSATPILVPPARSAHMGAGKRILHPQRPKTASYMYGLTRRQKTPKHPKTLLNHSARNGFWRPQVAARRSNTAPRPIRATPTVGAPSGACGRTTYAVIPPPPWHLGPDCGAFWPRASFLPLKSGAQSNQALVRFQTQEDFDNHSSFLLAIPKSTQLFS